MTVYKQSYFLRETKKKNNMAVALKTETPPFFRRAYLRTWATTKWSIGMGQHGEAGTGVQQ